MQMTMKSETGPLSSGGNNTELGFVVNSTLNWKDQVTIEVWQNDCCNPSVIIGSRNIQVTIWNEPLSLDGITRVTNWNLVQDTVNFTDSDLGPWFHWPRMATTYWRCSCLQ